MSHAYPDGFIYTGTVSHGTLRSEDLIATFLPILCNLDRNTANQVGDGEHDEAIIETVPYPLPDELLEPASELALWLIEKLDAAAPEGFYFGAHEGDGSDFGFWPIEDD